SVRRPARADEPRFPGPAPRNGGPSGQAAGAAPGSDRSAATCAAGALSWRRAGRQLVRMLGLLVAQGDLVGLRDVVCLDGPQSLTQALASLPKQLGGVAG